MFSIMKVKCLGFVILVLGAMSIANAQEVRGVETKIVCVVDCPDEESDQLWVRIESVYDGSNGQLKDWQKAHFYSVDHWSNNGRYCYMRVYPGVAHEFTNLNTIAVSVDAELYDNSGKLIGSKSFVLKSKESYVWKRGQHGIDIREKDEYYVKYKAYKLL